MRKFIMFMIAAVAAMFMFTACSDSDNDTPKREFEYFDRAVFDDFGIVKNTLEPGTECEMWAIHAQFTKSIFDTTTRIESLKLIVGINGVEKDSDTIIYDHNFLTGERKMIRTSKPTYEMSPIATSFAIDMTDAVTIFRRERGKMTDNGEVFDVPDTKTITIGLPLLLTLQTRHPHYIVTDASQMTWTVDVTDGYTYKFNTRQK